jgi:hypothetical protein
VVRRSFGGQAVIWWSGGHLVVRRSFGGQAVSWWSGGQLVVRWSVGGHILLVLVSVFSTGLVKKRLLRYIDQTGNQQTPGQKAVVNTFQMKLCEVQHEFQMHLGGGFYLKSSTFYMHYGRNDLLPGRKACVLMSRERPHASIPYKVPVTNNET